MSERTWTDRETLTGPQYIETMLRVAPLTIGAIYKKSDKVGQGYVLNLSRGGVFLAAGDPFEMGETFRLRFFLPFQLGQVDADVQVRWRTQDVRNPPKHLLPGFGLEFTRIESEARNRISRFIDKFVDLAEQLDGDATTSL